MKPISEINMEEARRAGAIELFRDRVGEQRGRTMLDLDGSHHADVEQMMQLARSWYASKRTTPGLSMALLGPVGVGKTHVAKACMDAFAYTDPDTGEWLGSIGRFYQADEIIQSLGEGRDLMAYLPESCPVVVIDDVGTEGTIPYVRGDQQREEVRRRYEMILNHCRGCQISLILTSNLVPDALREHLGPRAWSRLMEMAPKGFVLSMGNVPDYRLVLSGRQRG